MTRRTETLGFGWRAGATGRTRPSRGRRANFLIGASILAYAAWPTAAWAQCGAPPVGGGQVTCPTSGNPYAGGVTYDNQVDDLTIVLPPGVRITGPVSIRNIWC